MRVTKDRNSTVIISEFGLKLEVNPAQLLKQLMNERAQSLLDEMIELKYMALIQGFDSLCKIYPDVLNHESEEYYPIIQYLADFTRNILQLHSESEMIKLNTVLELSRDAAYSIWKYNSKYGFVPMKETNIEI